MRYALVAVNSPGPRRDAYTYSIPSHLAVSVGQAVWVPFGPRVLQGIVTGLADTTDVPQTRDIAAAITPQPLLSPERIKLACWISERYLCTSFEAVQLMLPPGFERQTVTLLHSGPKLGADVSECGPDERQVIALVRGRARVTSRDVERVLGQRRGKQVIQQLLRRGLVVKSQELERPRVKAREVVYANLAVSNDEVVGAIERLKAGASTRRQADVLEILCRGGGRVSVSMIKGSLGRASAAAIAAAEREGLLSVETVTLTRDPLAGRSYAVLPAPVLFPEQERAWRRLEEQVIAAAAGGTASVFLLHGVTGSGKTELYLRALQRTVERGRKGIVLVPEIAITPQTIQRFSSRFPGRVAVLHSRLSQGEQFDEWRRISQGEFDVVVGSRSAIFAPQPDLGLIVVDEEHEWTYKQQDRAPRYHAREVAVELGRVSRAVVILGSATPDVESYHRCETGDFRLLELTERIAGNKVTVLPAVELVDMREELKDGNRSIFSRPLQRALRKVLGADEQVILFLNRRGDATFVQCRRCGLALRCRRCDVSLTFHSVEDALFCHQCGQRVPVPGACPRCWNPGMKFLGVGTERVERDAAAAFPGARILRWDGDVTRGRGSHEAVLEKFICHQADILVGTQMIAKGLDLPRVTLVGVINADLGLNLPDFRAAERTYQLASQVAGRAGRGVCGGQVIVQTYNPEHFALQAAAKHDYVSFYRQEVENRRLFGHPPFCDLVRLVYTHANAEACRIEAEMLMRKLAEERDNRGLSSVEVMGPMPTFIGRIRGKYRYQVLLRGTVPGVLLSQMDIPRGWVVDVDPVGVM